VRRTWTSAMLVLATMVECVWTGLEHSSVSATLATQGPGARGISMSAWLTPAQPMALQTVCNYSTTISATASQGGGAGIVRRERISVLPGPVRMEEYALVQSLAITAPVLKVSLGQSVVTMEIVAVL